MTLANQVLDTFHNAGLVTTQAQPDGSVRTVVTRINDAQYQNAQRSLSTLNDNGFTAAQQKQHDEIESAKDEQIDENSIVIA